MYESGGTKTLIHKSSSPLDCCRNLSPQPRMPSSSGQSSTWVQNHPSEIQGPIRLEYVQQFLIDQRIKFKFLSMYPIHLSQGCLFQLPLPTLFSGFCIIELLLSSFHSLLSYDSIILRLLLPRPFPPSSYHLRSPSSMFFTFVKCSPHLPQHFVHTSQYTFTSNKSYLFNNL